MTKLFVSMDGERSWVMPIHMKHVMNLGGDDLVSWIDEQLQEAETRGQKEMMLTMSREERKRAKQPAEREDEVSREKQKRLKSQASVLMTDLAELRAELERERYRADHADGETRALRLLNTRLSQQSLLFEEEDTVPAPEPTPVTPGVSMVRPSLHICTLYPCSGERERLTFSLSIPGPP